MGAPLLDGDEGHVALIDDFCEIQLLRFAGDVHDLGLVVAPTRRR